MGHEPAVTESVYVVRGELSPEALTNSLQALLPVRRRPIARRRFTLLDTFDGRVRRVGARLTRTGADDREMLVWQGRGGRRQLAVRLTQPVSFAWDLPEGPFQRILAPVIGVRRLFAQADAQEHGSLLDILDDCGKTIARLRIESGQVRRPASGGAWQALPTLVTLTGLRGYEDAFTKLVPVIESRPGITPCPEGVHGVMLRHVGAPVWEKAAAFGLDLPPTVRADIGARRIHLALADILSANEPGLRTNLDTEFLHDFRVAVRRTRSLLGQIRHVFPADAARHFAAEFRWIGRLTGPPRDLDVLVLALRADRGDVPAADVEALIAYLGEMQRLEHHTLVHALDSIRYRRLLSEWRAFLERSDPSGLAGQNARRLLADIVARRAWRLSRRIARSADAIGVRTPPAELHEIRIDAKKLRYLIDVTPAFYDSTDVGVILGSLKKVQRVLGDFHDTVVQETRLLDCGPALGAAGGSAGALLVLGRLVEARRQRRERLRDAVAETLARFGAHAVRAACRRAFKRSRAVERAR